MRTHILAALVLATIAGPLAAQSDSTLPRRGKIDGVEREKNRGERRGDDCDCGGWFWLRVTADFLSAIAVPHGPGRGYQRFPYADSTQAHPFTVSHTERHRYFGTISATYFDDAASTLAGGQFRLEGASALWYGNLEMATYWEPLATETDRLQTWRAGLGVLPRISRTTLLRVGGAVRAIVLDDGSTTSGPELELGVHALPRRPFGINVIGRISGQSWGNGRDFAFRELNTSGSLFLGRLELEAGWHWAKMGSAAAFGGPTIGTRIWF